MLKRTPLSRTAAALLVLIGATSTFAADFPTVVATIMNAQTDSRIASLDPARKQQMIDCVNGVLSKLPNGKKRFVVEGASFAEQESRFGQVVQENRAEWEQKIARGCSSIVVGGGIGHR
jgi:hypothetical protein